jgi:hypothetical protein
MWPDSQLLRNLHDSASQVVWRVFTNRDLAVGCAVAMPPREGRNLSICHGLAAIQGLETNCNPFWPLDLNCGFRFRFDGRQTGQQHGQWKPASFSGMRKARRAGRTNSD